MLYQLMLYQPMLYQLASSATSVLHGTSTNLLSLDRIPQVGEAQLGGKAPAIDVGVRVHELGEGELQKGQLLDVHLHRTGPYIPHHTVPCGAGRASGWAVGRAGGRGARASVTVDRPHRQVRGAVCGVRCAGGRQAGRRAGGQVGRRARGTQSPPGRTSCLIL